MPLVIHDPEIIAAVKRLAAERGTTEEQVVREFVVPNATANGGDSPSLAIESDEDWLARVHAHTARMRASLPEPFSSADIDALLYDEHGLSK